MSRVVGRAMSQAMGRVAMGRVVSRALKRLRSERGESLTEVLAAIVVGALAILLLVGAVNAAANINRNSRAAMDTYYQANNELVARAGSDVQTGHGNVVEIVEDSSHSHVAWSSGDLEASYAIATETSDVPIVSYEYAGEAAGGPGA